MNVATVDIFNEDYQPKRKPDTFFESKVDTLVLSCAVYRHNNTFGIMDSIADSALTHADYVLASAIEQFYKNKLVIAKLKGKHLSKFKEDLLTFLTSDRKKVLVDDIPMITSLPKLYNEDLEVLKVTESLNKTCEDKTNLKFKGTFTYVGKVDKKHKNRFSCEYWFKDANNNAYMTEIGKKNPLLSIWEKSISTSEITVEGKFKYHDSDFQFHKFSHFKVL